MISYQFKRLCSGIVKYKGYIILAIVVYFIALAVAVIGLGYILYAGFSCSVFKALTIGYGCIVAAPLSKKILFIVLSILASSWFFYCKWN